MIDEIKTDRIHFIGIGGIGMSAIAEVFWKQGSQISGSDLSENENTRYLKKLGIRIYLGHQCGNLEQADVVIVSAAVKPDNPEVVEAARRGIPVIPRARLLSELMKDFEGLAISGSHGKTTTSALLAEVLMRGALDPTLVVGGRITSLGTNARLGQGPYLVAEADESDGSFLMLNPTRVVITGIDSEHLDYFKNMDALFEAFVTFANRVPDKGLVVACVDNPGVQAVLPKIKRRIVTYGMSPRAECRALDICHQGSQLSFEVVIGKERLGKMRLNMQGRHNVLNALAVLSMSLELGIDLEIIKATFESFGGVERRLSLRGEAQGISIFDDYGHHPSEIKTTLNGAADAWKRRLVVVFQPHRYSRTRDLAEGFATAFHRADLLGLMDIYAAGDPAIPGVSSENLIEGIRESGHPNTHYLAGKRQAVEWLQQNTQTGDVVITMGAGDVWEIGRMFLSNLKARVEGGG